MKRSESKEMYLETIYKLQLKFSHAHTGEIAKELNVSKPSVNKAINILKSEGLANQEPYGPITLTSSGIEIAKDVLAKHKLIFDFLSKSLDVATDVAETNACRIEHVLSDELIKAIEKYNK